MCLPVAVFAVLRVPTDVARWVATWLVVAIGAPIVGQQSDAAAARGGDNSFEFDVYAFSQGDSGGSSGQPFRAEGFDYYSLRGALRVRLDEERVLNLTAQPAYIESETIDLPPTILGGSTISATGDLATLDALASLDYTPLGSEWTFSPGLFYHHQIDYTGAGLDLGLTRQLNQGATTLGLNYSLRHDFLELSFWDGSFRGSDVRVSNNLMVSWSQLLSPSWKGNISLQYSRQDGFLEDQHNYVALFDLGGVPQLLTDEVLPNRRNRVQLNLRSRYSPGVGHALGVDASYYQDDWSIRHFALEPSAELSLGGGFRMRAWWRYSNQDGTRFLREQPQVAVRLQTQDSDLGDFTMHSPGVTLYFPLGDKGGRTGSFSIYGFDRSDGIDGIGGKLQFVHTW